MNPTRRKLLFATGASAAAFGLGSLRDFDLPRATAATAAPTADAPAFEVTHTDEEWHKLLTPAQYDVLRREGTEYPFSSALNIEHRAGRFFCAGCALELFSSKTKFDSGTGWPSFWQPLPHAVLELSDSSLGMQRTAVSCRRCGSHLGHVFDDGPRPTGLRYCMNGIALAFKPGVA